MGALDQGSASRRARCRRGTSTRASASRSSRTTCRSATSRSTPIVRWVDAGAPQGNPKDLPPPKPLVTDNEWQGVKDGFGPPDLVIKSSEYTMPAQHQDVWYRPMSDIPLTEPRWVKMVEIRPTNLKARKDHAPLDRVSGAQRRSRRRSTRAPPTARQARSTHGRSGQPPAAAHGVGDRQGLRSVPRGHRQADRAGREDLVGSAHPCRRRRDHGRLRDRPLVLPERAGAEEAQLPDRLHRPRAARLPRHPAELDLATPKASRC